MSSSKARGEVGGELHYDAISGKAMATELVEATRKIEMETEKGPIEERWEKTGKGPAGGKRVDANKGAKENPEYRCRLAAKETKKDTRVGFLQRRPHWGRGRCCSHFGRACR